MTGRFCVRQGTAREWSGAAGCGKLTRSQRMSAGCKDIPGESRRTCIVKLADGLGAMSS